MYFFACRYVLDNERNVVSRLIWLALVLAGIALALFQIQERITYYSENPTSTNVEVADVRQLRFPQVTICSENRYKKSNADQYGMTCTMVIGSFLPAR